MKIIVFSDSHGDYDRAAKLLHIQHDADMFIFLGDGVSDIEGLKIEFPDADIRAVRGNCDSGADYPDELVITVGKRRLYAVHGHLHSVKYSEAALTAAAQNNMADAVLFGHTHEQFCGRTDDIWFLNPGSLTRTSYSELCFGIIEIDSRELYCYTTKTPYSRSIIWKSR